MHRKNRYYHSTTGMGSGWGSSRNRYCPLHRHPPCVDRNSITTISITTPKIGAIDQLTADTVEFGDKSIVAATREGLERILGGEVRGHGPARYIDIPHGVDGDLNATVFATSPKIRAVDQSTAGTVEFGDKSIGGATTINGSLERILGGEVRG